MKRRPDCLIVGDVMFDICLKLVSVECLSPEEPDIFYPTEVRIMPGGAGNVAVALAHLGCQVAFLGKAGNDALGLMYRDDLFTHGVNAKIILEPDQTTGMTITLVWTGGERTFLVYRGANDLLMPEEVISYWNELGGAEFLYISGYSLAKEPQRKAIKCAVELASAQGSKIVFDPGSEVIIRSARKLVLKLASSAHVLSLNMTEARALTAAEKLTDILDALSRLAPLVALKLGSEGCILYMNGAFYKAPASKVKVVDTTGAGDAFTAALIYGLKEGLRPPTLATFANWFASRVVSKLGARGFPAKEEIMEFLRKLVS